MVQTGWERGIDRPGTRRGWARRFGGAPAAIAGLALLVTALQPVRVGRRDRRSRTRTRATIALAVDAELTDPGRPPDLRRRQRARRGSRRAARTSSASARVRASSPRPSTTRFPADQIVTADLRHDREPARRRLRRRLPAWWTRTTTTGWASRNDGHVRDPAGEGRQEHGAHRRAVARVGCGRRRAPRHARPFTVRAECVGDTLTLFEGNQPIASVRDELDHRGTPSACSSRRSRSRTSTVQVDSLSVRAFRDRGRITDAAAAGWDDLLRTQSGLEPLHAARSEARDAGATAARCVTRCGSVVLHPAPDPRSRGARRSHRILDDSGAILDTVKGLPNCAKRTGIHGPLPPPTPPPASRRAARAIGQVACLDLGDATAVVWVHDLSGVIGITRVEDDDRAAWKGYGPDWPPFAYEEQPRRPERARAAPGATAPRPARDASCALLDETLVGQPVGDDGRRVFLVVEDPERHLVVGRRVELRRSPSR